MIGKTAAVLVIICALAAPAAAADYGVYVQVLEGIEGEFDSAVAASEAALGAAGWELIASYDAAVPDGCTFRAHTSVVNSAGYAGELLTNGPRAAFALPLRVSLYESETGLNAAFLNPASLNRTVLGDGVGEELSLRTMEELSSVLAGALTGTRVDRQIGQVRDKGRVGGMGGGDFEKKVEEIYAAVGGAEAYRGAADAVGAGLAGGSTGWELVYTLEYPGSDVTIFGLRRAETEAKAYGIAGEKRKSKENACPGIDHAPAFPIEVVAYLDGDTARVETLDEMYRMKVYYEDAGKWAFMKNMKMPGRIEDQIVEAAKSKLH